MFIGVSFLAFSSAFFFTASSLAFLSSPFFLGSFLLFSFLLSFLTACTKSKTILESCSSTLGSITGVTCSLAASVTTMRILTVLPCSKRCSAVLPLKAGLIRTSKLYQCLISLHSVSPDLNGNTALQCFERGNTVKIRN